jgi:hypothetical protein
MGYRSDVMCIMYARDVKDVDKVDEAGMAFIKAWLNSRLAEEDKNLFEFDHDDMVVFSVEQWKWYDSYSDIQRLDKLFADFMELCDESNGNYYLEFMRVGESYDDVETRYSQPCHGLLSLHRSIYIDGR